MSEYKNVGVKDIIRERKAERKLEAEEKRQVDLQRVRDKWSTSGIDPLDEFPKEIWEKIFDELDPEDRGNIWEVHPLFRDLMEDNRIRDILLPLLVKKDAFRSILGSRDNMRSLRCISKSMRKAVDRFLDDTLEKAIQEMECSFSRNFDLEQNTDILLDDFINLPQLKKLLTFYVDEGKIPGKPVFPRRITFDMMSFLFFAEENEDVLEYFNHFKNDMTTLLEAVGDQIWYFDFSVYEADLLASISTYDAYALLFGWISLMPNLRWLEVYIQNFGMNRRMTSEGGGLSFIPPFPHLPHLERLSFSLADEENEKELLCNMFEHLLGVNQHIKILDLQIPNDGSEFFQPVNISLIKSLQLTRLSVANGRKENLLQRIEPVVNYNWPLKTIILELSTINEGESLAALFRFLEKFSTLEKVEVMDLSGFSIADTDTTIGYLKLPNLTHLELQISEANVDYDSNLHWFFTLQFLMQCKKLQKLNWIFGMFRSGFNYSKIRNNLEKFQKDNQSEILDFKAGLNFLYDSNIWDVFPCLNYVRIINHGNAGPERYACSHTYTKADKRKNMSIDELMRSHRCTRELGAVANCLMFVDGVEV